jgi:hypothetical protein
MIKTRIQVKQDNFGALFNVLEKQFNFTIQHKSTFIKLLSKYHSVFLIWKYGLPVAIVLGLAGCIASAAISCITFQPAGLAASMIGFVGLSAPLINSDSVLTSSTFDLLQEDFPQITCESEKITWLPENTTCITKFDLEDGYLGCDIVVGDAIHPHLQSYMTNVKT